MRSSRGWLLLLVALSLVATTTEAVEVSVSGWLVDKKCLELCKDESSDASCTPDGINVYHRPAEHTAWCLRLGVCVESGYVLLSETADPDAGKHIVVLDLGDAPEAVADFLARVDTDGPLPRIEVAYDDTATIAVGEGGAPRPAAIVGGALTGMRDAFVERAVSDQNEPKYQTTCGHDDALNVAANHLCLRSDVSIATLDAKKSFEIMSSGCPDHSNMRGGRSGVPSDGDGCCGGCCGKGCGGSKCCGKGCGGGCGGCYGDKGCNGGRYLRDNVFDTNSAVCCGSDTNCSSCGAGCCGSSSTGCCGSGTNCSSCGSGCCGSSSTGCSSCGSGCCGSTGCSGGKCCSGCSGGCGGGCYGCGGGCGGCTGCGGCGGCGGGCYGCGGGCCGGGCGGCTGCGGCGGGCYGCGGGCGGGCTGCGGCGGGCTGCGGCGGGCTGCGGCGGCGGKGGCSGDHSADVGTYDPVHHAYRMVVPQNPGAPGTPKYFKDGDDVFGMATNGVLLSVHEQTWSYDSCNGHSDKSHRYHYHLPPRCFLSQSGSTVPAGIHWWLVDGTNVVNAPDDMVARWPARGEPGVVVGIARDGFPVYGPYDENGARVRKTDTDECLGRVDRNGRYGYHLIPEPPFAPPCLRGDVVGTFESTPTTIDLSKRTCPADGVPNTVLTPTMLQEAGCDDVDDGFSKLLVCWKNYIKNKDGDDSSVSSSARIIASGTTGAAAAAIALWL